MPISKHYRGSGLKVERSMRRRYGKDWKNVFYATEKKLGIQKNPGEIDKHEELTEEELLVNAMVALTMLEHRTENDPEISDELAANVQEANELLAEAAECLEDWSEQEQPEDY